MDFFNTSFWQGFVGNLLATILGVAVGIPVAFWINRRVEASTEREKKDKILLILNEELDQAITLIRQWRSNGEQMLDVPKLSLSMSDELWRTLSDGGELQWIKDPQVILYFAKTYAYMRHLKFLSEKYLDALSDRDGKREIIGYFDNEIRMIILQTAQMIEMTKKKTTY